MWSEFHFLRPEWLFALPFVMLFLVLLLTRKQQNSGWETICDKELLQFQLTQYGNPVKKSLPLFHWTIPFLLFITLIALAGPAWEKKEQPVFQQGNALVIILDLSQSMNAQDIKPSRLERSKLKLIDILKQKKEGQTALIAFAGDAHVVSPLTIDNKTIISLLPALESRIMPRSGSHLIDALASAKQLFKNAGFVQGDILLITDGIDSSQTTELKTNIKALSQQGYRLSIIGVGSQTGSPIPLSNENGFVKDASGQVILSKLQAEPLSELTRIGHGHYQKLSLDDSDFEHLLDNRQAMDKAAIEQDNAIEQWYDAGVYFTLLLIPLALLNFRKGLFSLIIVFLLTPFLLIPFFIIEPVLAEDIAAHSTTSQPATIQPTTVKEEENPWARRWQQLWSTADQQGQKAFQAQNYTQAADSFANKDWQAGAYYKAGNFAQALEHYSQFDDATSLYNKANTLANMQQFEQAKEAYEEALKKQPDFSDAQKNLDYINELLKQQQKQQEQQNSEQSDKDKKDSDDQQKNQEQNQKSNNDEQSDKDNQAQSEQSENNQKEQNSESESDNSQQEEQSKEQQEEQKKLEEQIKEQLEEAKKSAKEAQSEEQEAQEAQAEEGSSEDVLSQLSQEQQQSLKQWLQRIPDNPGKLLEVKFRRNTLLKQEKMTVKDKYEGNPW